MNYKLLLTLFCIGCVPDLPDTPAPQTPAPQYVFTVQRLQPIARAEPLPEPPSVQPRRWVAFFTSDKCGPCLRAKRETLPKLAKRGYAVSPQKGQAVYVIDVDQRPDMLTRHKVESLPCWIFCSDEVETSREVGFLTADEIIQRLTQEAK